MICGNLSARAVGIDSLSLKKHLDVQWCFVPFEKWSSNIFNSIHGRVFQHEIEPPENQKSRELSASALKNKKKRDAKARSKKDNEVRHVSFHHDCSKHELGFTP